MPVARRRRAALGQAVPDLSSFRALAAAPAPPVTGKAYVWAHPSGLFYVAIGADGSVGGFVGPDGGPVTYRDAWTDEQKGTAQVVGDLWAYPFLHGSGIAAAVTGNEEPDSALLADVENYFAFNKGQVSTTSGTEGTNTLQTATIAEVPQIATAAAQTQIATQSAGAQTAIDQATADYGQKISAVKASAADALASAAAALNISGPGLAQLMNNLGPELQPTIDAAVATLAGILASGQAKWSADLAALQGGNPSAANTLNADLAATATAFDQALATADAAIGAEAMDLLETASSGAGASAAPSASGGTPTGSGSPFIDANQPISTQPVGPSASGGGGGVSPLVQGESFVAQHPALTLLGVAFGAWALFGDHGR